MKIRIAKQAGYSKCQSKQEVHKLGRKYFKSTIYLHIPKTHKAKEMKQKVIRRKEINHRTNKSD